MTTEAGVHDSADLVKDDPFELASGSEISSGEVFAMEASSYAINQETNTSNTREWVMDTGASDHI